MAKRINKAFAIKRFMEEHPLGTAFITDAIYQYSKSQLTAPEWEGVSFVNQDLWRELASKAIETVTDA